MSSVPEAKLSLQSHRPVLSAEPLFEASADGAVPASIDLRTKPELEDSVARHRREYQDPAIWIWRRIVGAAFAFIVVTMLWYLIKVPSGLVSDRSLPTQSQVASAFQEARTVGFAGETLGHHLGLSLFRLVVGFGLGSTVGMSLGLIAGAAPLVRTVTDPISSFFRMMPALAVAPILLVWFGAGEVGIVFVVAFTVTWNALGLAADAGTQVLRGRPVDLVLEAIAGLRSSLLIAWATVLALETVVATSGLGWMIWNAQSQTDMMVVGFYVAGLLGFVLDTALRAVQYVLYQFGRER